MPAALDVNWDVIRLKFSHGASLEQLADEHGVKFGTLAARSSREGWMQTRPETHAKIAIRNAKPVLEAVKGNTDDLVHAAKSQGQSLAERGQAYAARMFAKTSQLAELAEIKTIKSVKDWEIVDKMARRAAGLDTAEVNIQTVIGVGGFEESPVLAPVMEAEVVNNPSAD